MRRFFKLLSVVGALFLVSCADKPETPQNADVEEKVEESYILADSEISPLPYKAGTMSENLEMKNAEFTVEAGGRTMGGEISNETQILTKVDRLGDYKIRRTVVSDINTGTMVLEGREMQPPQESNPLVGVPVLVEYKDEEFKVYLEEGVPTDEQQAELDKLVEQFESNESLVMYGEEPRKPGDKWDVDPAELTSFAGGSDFSGTFTVEFLKVEEVNGVKFAKLQCVFDISGMTDGEDDENQMVMSVKGEADIIRSIPDKVDLSVNITSDVIIEGELSDGARMTIDGKMKMSQTVELERD